ncbi:MAG TPA: ABC transporter permease, partial [Limnochordales bacterium]
TYLVKRVLLAVPTVLGALTLVFFALHLMPGDPARIMLGEWVTPEALEALRHRLGLDRPLHEQYLIFLHQYLSGDFGRSLLTERLIITEIMARLPHTLLLAVAAMALAVAVGLPVGVLAAVYHRRFWDRLIMTLALVGFATPGFWLGILLILVFSVKLEWLPAVGSPGFDDPVAVLRHLLMPAVALSARPMALIARVTRSTMLEVIREDFVRTARAKGLSERAVIYRHVLRNALVSVVTIIGLNFGTLLGGAVLIETVFARPGLGKLTVDAILARDFPTVQATTFLVAVLFVFINLLTDLAYAYIDPRVKYQ